MNSDAAKKALEDRGALRPCPACGNSHWIIVDEKTDGKPAIMLLSPNAGFSIPPPHIPTVTVVCANCGFLRQHAEMILSKPKGTLG